MALFEVRPIAGRRPRAIDRLSGRDLRQLLKNACGEEQACLVWKLVKPELDPKRSGLVSIGIHHDRNASNMFPDIAHSLESVVCEHWTNTLSFEIEVARQTPN
jgi:hypothetical protein